MGPESQVLLFLVSDAVGIERLKLGYLSAWPEDMNYKDSFLTLPTQDQSSNTVLCITYELVAGQPNRKIIQIHARILPCHLQILSDCFILLFFM